MQQWKYWFQLTKINDSPFFTNASRTLAFIILSVAWLIHIYFFLVSWSNDPHNTIPLGYASPSLFSQYLRSILPDCQPVLGGPRAPLTLHCEFKLGRNICDYNRSLHTFITLIINFIFSTYFSYMRLRTYYMFYWFILCSRGYIESKKKFAFIKFCKIPLRKANMMDFKKSQKIN